MIGISLEDKLKMVIFTFIILGGGFLCGFLFGRSTQFAGYIEVPQRKQIVVNEFKKEPAKVDLSKNKCDIFLREDGKFIVEHDGWYKGEYDTLLEARKRAVKAKASYDEADMENLMTRKLVE